MDPELMLPKSPGGVGLLLVVLAACGWFFWFMINRLNKRSQAEGDLDSRLPLILDTSLAPWKQLVEMQKAIIDEERKEKLRAQDEREAITKQFIEYSTQQDNIHRAEMDKIRDDARASAERVHMRLDECTARDAANQTRLAEAVRRLEMLEQHDRATYNAFRTQQQVQPLLVQPVVSVPPQG